MNNRFRMRWADERYLMMPRKPGDPQGRGRDLSSRRFHYLRAHIFAALNCLFQKMVTSKASALREIIAAVSNLATAVIGISSIHLLKTFISAENYSEKVHIQFYVWLPEFASWLSVRVI